MVRVIAAALFCCATTAHADPGNLRVAIGANRTALDSGESDETRLPGPAVSLDLMSRRGPRLGVGVHLGWNAAFNSQDDPDNTPHHTSYLDQLAQLHGMLELRQDRVALGAGLGIDVFHSRVRSISDGASPYSQTAWSMGGNLQLAVDVASIDQGVLGIVAGAGVFSAGAGLLGLVWPIDLCDSGEISCLVGTTVSLGVGFRGH